MLPRKGTPLGPGIGTSLVEAIPDGKGDVNAMQCKDAAINAKERELVQGCTAATFKENLKWSWRGRSCQPTDCGGSHYASYSNTIVYDSIMDTLTRPYFSIYQLDLSALLLSLHSSQHNAHNPTRITLSINIFSRYTVCTPYSVLHDPPLCRGSSPSQ